MLTIKMNILKATGKLIQKVYITIKRESQKGHKK